MKRPQPRTARNTGLRADLEKGNMNKTILTKTLLLPMTVLSLMMAADARGDESPCPAKLKGPDACTWWQSADTTWREFDIALKKPAGDLNSEQNKALLARYSNMLFGNYFLRTKSHPDVQLPRPAEADMKWEYTGLYCAKYFFRTLDLDDNIATLTLRPATNSGLHVAARAWAPDASLETFSLDGRRLPAGTEANARLAEVKRTSDRTVSPK
jgi:hypothetical protein